MTSAESNHSPDPTNEHHQHADQWADAVPAPIPAAGPAPIAGAPLPVVSTSADAAVERPVVPLPEIDPGGRLAALGPHHLRASGNNANHFMGDVREEISDETWQAALRAIGDPEASA